MDGLEQLVPQLEDRQALTLLLDRLAGLLSEGHGLADVELLPLRQLVGGLPETAQRLRHGTLTRLRSWIFPRPVHVLRDRVQQTLLHRLARLAPLLGQRGLSRGRARQAAVRLLDNLHRRQRHAGLGRLAAQEDGLRLLELNLVVFLDVAVGEQALLLVAVQALVVLEHARGAQLLRLPLLVLRKLFLLPQLVPGSLVVRELELDASDPAGPLSLRVVLALAHGVGRIVLIALDLLLALLQVLAGDLVHLSQGQVELATRNADDLTQDLVVALHPVGRAGHVARLLRDLAQVDQALLPTLRRLKLNEATVLHDSLDLAPVDAVQLDRRGPAEVRLLWALVLVLALAAAPAPARAAPTTALRLLLPLLGQLPVIHLLLQELLGVFGQLAFRPRGLDLQLLSVGPIRHGEPWEFGLPLALGLLLAHQGRRTSLHRPVGGGAAALRAHLADEPEQALGKRPLCLRTILLELDLEVIDARGLLADGDHKLGQGLVLDAPVVLDLDGDLGDQA
mmetsp:Transcript_49286/g.127098  ORF Transcript_49286/g.127098 Transcript_49286/m.127098 type:complete len:508 (+) Transcript_49286:2003-3526(+)